MDAWKETWRADWKRTPAGVRLVMIVISALIVVTVLATVANNSSIHDYPSTAGFWIGIAWLGLRLVIWPWRLAWAAARRGGNLNVWFVGTFIGGFIITGLVYLLGRGRKPVLEAPVGDE